VQSHLLFCTFSVKIQSVLHEGERYTHARVHIYLKLRLTHHYTILTTSLLMWPHLKRKPPCPLIQQLHNMLSIRFYLGCSARICQPCVPHKSILFQKYTPCFCNYPSQWNENNNNMFWLNTISVTHNKSECSTNNTNFIFGGISFDF